ncbi:MFS transporter [Gimesia fumaroli]|uniref:Major Facilitator Superfamily protein n=1 Tax=Gimesia fumaroli TaxID=2527976 RepID=A0A518I9S3_9PLAN|nr:MFS transporter [Gimesia fumaroli]QDV49857.1 Major Facilitator Superfamily protein [Gimesia fumaroli]
MILRFYLYSFLKNLRFSDPFLILFFLDQDLSYTGLGLLLSLQHLVTVLLEFPSGLLADHWGRRRVTALCFAMYATSFVGFGMTGQRGANVPAFFWLVGCLMFFALGEALRTGSHKAIMLDYLDSTGQSERATQLIGRTRSVSKMTSATAAICGGILLAWSRDYAPLFYLSAGAACCGFVLLLTYPRSLEGDLWRERQHQQTASHPVENRPFRVMWQHSGFRALFIQSVLFECQLKIILKYFTQPFLKVGLGLLGISIIAAPDASGIATMGAFCVGLSEFLRDSVGSLGARLSPHFEQQTGDRRVALNRVYQAGLLAGLVLAVCTWNLKWGLLPGILILTVLTLLQNLRRPIFVSELNTQMLKAQRASVLSLESVSRAVMVAVLLPLFGWAADQFGLIAVWSIAACILTVGLCWKLKSHRETDRDPGELSQFQSVQK